MILPVDQIFQCNAQRIGWFYHIEDLIFNILEIHFLSTMSQDLFLYSFKEVIQCERRQVTFVFEV